VAEIVSNSIVHPSVMDVMFMEFWIYRNLWY